MTREGSISNGAFIKCVDLVDALYSQFDAFCGWQNCEECLIGKRRCRGFHRKLSGVRNSFWDVRRRLCGEGKNDN